MTQKTPPTDLNSSSVSGASKSKLSIKKEQVLQYHDGSLVPSGSGEQRFGKIEIVATKPLNSQRDLSIAYSPGVAEPCREIARDPELAYRYTAKGNLVAVISNGTAVLGLGDIGPLAGKPVFEGKAVLFKKYADIDAIDIELKPKDVDAFCQAVEAMELTFGGINLEDIAAPSCFEIERRLRERLQIPVFHDDQHGTAIISGAAVLNAAEISGRKLSDLKVVFLGGGAASISCARFWLQLGLQKKNCIMLDREGVITRDRGVDLNPDKLEFALDGTAWHQKQPRNLAEAVVGADVLMGCSVGNVVTVEMLRSMAPRPIVFAMANPDPEISYELAMSARDDMIFATGRSDHPNQVNNVLCFPYIFRGALDVRARTINEDMKIAAARALCELAKQPVPESVVRAYGGARLSFGPQYIIPKPNDPRVLVWVASAVAQAAIESGVAAAEFPGGNLDGYRARLQKLQSKGQSVVRDWIDRVGLLAAQRNDRPVRIVYPEGNSPKILKAAELVRDEGIAEPVLLGESKLIQAQIEKLGLSKLDGVEMIHPRKSPDFDRLVEQFWADRQRKGLTLGLAEQQMKDTFYFGAMMVKTGQADAWLAGVTRTYPETLRPAIQVIGAEPGKKVAGLYMAIWKDRTVFLADTTVNIDPSAEDLADIASNTAVEVRALGFEPRIAMLSFSNFGSNPHPEAQKVRRATEILQRRHPDLLVDGEMQADTAVNKDFQTERFPFSKIREGANVLIFPNLSAANSCYKLLQELGGAEMIGPILLGMKQVVHVMPLNAHVQDIRSMSVVCALEVLELRKNPLGVLVT